MAERKRDFLAYEEESDSLLYSYIVQIGMSKESSIEKLDEALQTSFKYQSDKRIIPYLICLGLINNGINGIKTLKKALSYDIHVTWINVLFNALLSASQGFMPRKVINEFEDFEKSIRLDDVIIMTAKKCLLDFVVEAQNDYTKFEIITNFFYMEKNYVEFYNESESDLIRNFYSLISCTSINISSDLINQFEEMIDHELREEDYQKFLEINPVFLNPLARNIIDKRKLGDDYITDFVLPLINDEYILVEIEKPQDKIFTVNNEFTSIFTHAFGQVLDFINWVDDNIAYAEKKLHGIKHPKGMLIMGRRNQLNSVQMAKLKNFNDNSYNIQILTFDDLVINTKRLLDNMLK